MFDEGLASKRLQDAIQGIRGRDFGGALGILAALISDLDLEFGRQANSAERVYSAGSLAETAWLMRHAPCGEFGARGHRRLRHLGKRALRTQQGAV